MSFTSCRLSSPRAKRCKASSLGWVEAGLVSRIAMSSETIDRRCLAGFPQLRFRLNYRTTAVFTGSGNLVCAGGVVRVTKTSRLALDLMEPFVFREARGWLREGFQRRP
jgi:hypothetical protein